MQPAVLIVAADGPDRDSLHELLAEAGYAVAEVSDGAAALDLLRLNLARKRPHRLVVLVSESLLRMGGADLLRTIAADPHLATHHAYVLLTPAGGPAFPLDEHTLPTLTIASMPQPLTRAALLDTVAQAAGGLGIGSEGTSRRD